jgi:hypothetical protein
MKISASERVKILRLRQNFPFGVLGRNRLPFIFLSTQPAPDKTGVIPAVLPVKGLR